MIKLLSCFITVFIYYFILRISTESALAESYFSGQFGVTFPNDLERVEVLGTQTGVPAGTQSSDLALKNSIVYGLKLGHYFESPRWLGLETEVFETHPDVKQQTVNLTSPGGSITPVTMAGRELRVSTWALNVLARYPGESLQPYAGIGLGIFFAREKTFQGGQPYSESSTRPGLNALVGVRHLLTKHIVLFGEWKYSHTRFTFDQTANLAGAKGEYNAQNLVVGIGVQF